MEEPKTVFDFRSKKYVSSFVVSDFDDSIYTLRKNGYGVISLQENALLRMNAKEDPFILDGNWVKEGFLFTNDKKIFLTRDSPLIQDSTKANIMSKHSKEYVPSDKQIEKILEDSIEISKSLNIPTLRFSEEQLTSYVFGDLAQCYGEFLKDRGIDQMPIWNVNIPNERPFVRQAWFRLLGDGSGIYSGVRRLHHDYILRGIKLVD